MRKTLRSLLLALAILVPASALAIYGLRAYRAEALLLRERYSQDQSAIMRLVADRLSESARKALEDLEERCGHADPDAVMEERFIAAQPLARHIFLVREGRLVYPAPTPNLALRARQTPGPEGQLVSALDIATYVGRLREARRLAGLLAEAQRAEYGGHPARAAALYAQAERGRGPLAARAFLGEARVQRRLGRAGAAAQAYAALRDRFGGQQDAEGVSFALLAEAGAAEVGPATTLLRVHDSLMQGDYVTSAESRRFYLRWIVEQLSRRGGIERRTIARLRRSTAHLFTAERFADALLRHGIFELQQLASSSAESIGLDRRTTLVLRERGATVTGYALDERALRGQLDDQRRRVVPGGGIELSLDRLGEAPAVARERILRAAVLPEPLSTWTLTGIRPVADPVELLGRRQGVRHQALVLGLILILLGGIVATYLGVRRESELARLKSDFASNVSHELKTPLTSIRMYAEMLQEGIAGTPADRERYQQVIIRESERLGRLIANVLDFSRLERGTRRYDLVPVDLEELARDALETFGRLSEGERITINVQAAGKLPPVIADCEAAVQSILNLLSNAAKYSFPKVDAQPVSGAQHSWERPETTPAAPPHRGEPDGAPRSSDVGSSDVGSSGQTAPVHRAQPEIELELKVGRGEVGLLVRDHGIGIPHPEQRKIFDDFYRAPGARRAGVEGTGLGLALVRRHLAACGGRVELWSAPGLGSEFTLWFRQAVVDGQPRRERARTVSGSITLMGEPGSSPSTKEGADEQS